MEKKERKELKEKLLVGFKKVVKGNDLHDRWREL